ncbi:hypothetical protein [Streptomyces sp. enrichment culture]|uniref:hypothetical protein n=1 Tax=Streptomyces sp. enrichment culture TaxID=1795815 RepID=UPI003F5510F5
MKDVLLAVDDEVTRAGGRLDPGMSVPLAESLADYASDTGVMLGMGSADYVARSSASEPAWEDDEGVHMAVPRAALLRTVRAVSEEPKAFVVLRLAATRHAAEGLAAVERDATGAELAAPPARTAHTLGALDAVAEDVREDLGARKAAEWEREVFQGLTKRIPEPSSYDEDPVNHLIVSWRRALLTKGTEGSRTLLERQSADMVDVWSRALGLDGKVRRSLRYDSLNSSSAARGNTGRELD